MIVIDKVLVSEDVVEKKFICDLSKCKGGCCEEGDAGAPLTNDELKMVDEYYESVKPYLSAASVQWVDANKKYQYDEEFGWVTPTLAEDNEICVYAFREKNGLIKCAFEQAHADGLIPWKKPISCHLYPIISKKGKYGDYERMNYEPREKLCAPGCKLGEELQLPVYKFLKEPLIRKYGEAFYDALDTIAKTYFDQQQESKQ